MRSFLTTPTRARHVAAVCALLAALPAAIVATDGTPCATLAPLVWTVVFLWTAGFMLFPDPHGRLTNLASMRGGRPTAPTKRWRDRIDPRSVDRGRSMDREVRRILRFAAGLIFAAGAAVVHAVAGLLG